MTMYFYTLLTQSFVCRCTPLVHMYVCYTECEVRDNRGGLGLLHHAQETVQDCIRGIYTQYTQHNTTRST
jgi:hypothetical protein